MRPKVIVMVMMMVYAFSVASFAMSPSTVGLADDSMQTSTGVPTKVSVSAYPNGTSNALTLEIPENEAVTGLELRIQPDTLHRNEIVTWSGTSDWNATGTNQDRINVNQSGLQMLPKKWEWDFETGPSNAPQGWTLGNGWLWGYDTSMGQSAGVHGGTKAIYTYNGNYPNNIPSSGYFATSPVIDCGGCSGNWRLKYWKKLGIESYYFDDAQVHVKDQQGAWRTVWDWNSYSTNPTSWTQMNHDITQYATGNSNLQIRFKLGRTDGSVTYTGWNVDDVSVEPSSGGGGSDAANWTSPSFGPAITGTNGMTPGAYGQMSIDAMIPNNAILRTSILDGRSNTPIPGFDNLEDLHLDLGPIDSNLHPELKVHLYFATPNGAQTPIVHGIHLNGRIATTFEVDPSSMGWTLTGSNWDGDSINGGTATSPVYTSSRAISQIALSTSGSGTTAEYSVDGGTWSSIATTSTTVLNEIAETVQFRFSGSSMDLASFQADLIPGLTGDEMMIDIGADGISEWNFEHIAVGSLGWQDLFANGQRSIGVNFGGQGGQLDVPILLPEDGIDSLSFVASPGALPPPGFNWTLIADGTEVASGSPSLSTIGTNRINLTASEINDLNTAISGITVTNGPADLPHVEVTLRLESPAGSYRISSLNARSTPTIDLAFGPGSPIVMAVNDVIPTSPLTGLTRLVTVPFVFDLPAAISVTIIDLESSSSFTTDVMSFANVTTTISPSYQWMEVHTSHTVEDGLPAEIQIDIDAIQHSATVTMDITQNTHSITQRGNFPGDLLILHPDDAYEHWLNGSNVDSIFRFMINASWDDEPEVRIKSRIVLDDGRRSVPKIQMIGIGPRNGIENDVMLRTWSILNDLDVAVPLSESYLKSDADIAILAELGFPDTDNSLAPRTGDVTVHLHLNGEEIANTSQIDEGVARFDIKTPMTTGDVEYEISISSHHGAEISYALPTNRTFTVDSIQPEVVGMNIARIDHLQQNPAQTLRFEIFDRPILPSNIALMLWREWEDDLNGDGHPDADEYKERPIQIPWNRTQANGNYTIVLDDRLAPDGALVYGYLIGADPAGNALTNNGAPGTEQTLFVYQLKTDGAPLLSEEGVFETENLGYLHPGTDYTLRMPLFEPNGHADIETAEIQLASNSQTDLMPIIWSTENGTCASGSANFDYLDCRMISENEEPLTPFTMNSILEVDFRLGWNIAVEDELRREPTLEVIDHAGQSAWRSYPELRWRFSPDLAIDSNSIHLNPYEGTSSLEGAWMRPNGLMGLNGTVVFPSSGLSPSQAFTVSIIFDGSEVQIETDNEGRWSTELNAPLESGDHPLVFELIGLPPQSRDMTDPLATLLWVTVDGDDPRPSAIVSPRTTSVISIEELDNLTIELTIDEQGEIDPDNMDLNWALVKRNDASRTVAQGSTPLHVSSSSLSGKSIPATSIIEVSGDIPNSAFMEALELRVWVSGADRAGNQYTATAAFNSAQSPFAVWEVEILGPEFAIMEDLVYSKRSGVTIGESLTISADVRNIGELDGQVGIKFIAESTDGRQIEINQEPIPVDIRQGERMTVPVDWSPNSDGRYVILVYLDGDLSATGDPLDVLQPVDEGLLSGDDLGFTLIIGLMFILLAVILVGVVMVAVRNGGDGDDWDDYDEEVWDHTDEFEKEEAIQKDREREEIAKARAESTPRPQPKQQPSTGADPRLEGMDRKTYDYWAQQGYSHQQIVDWWSQSNM